MRRGTLKHSELIRTIGWDNNILEVEYRADKKVFQYFGVPLSAFRALVRSKHPGEDFLKIRDQYKFKEVK
jgi:hypothetical protein